MPAGNPTYFNATSMTMIDYQVDQEEISAQISRDLVDVPFEQAAPMRTSVSYPGKPSYEGEYWSATTRHHVPFESFRERLFAMLADFRPDIVGISWQPFVLRWPKGTPRHRGHVPDYFCRLANGDGLLVDVKRADKVDRAKEQFDLTREVCNTIGWQYEIFTGLPEPFASNLQYLAGFRQDRYSPDRTAHDLIMDAFRPATSLSAGTTRAAGAPGLSQHVARGNILHMLWHHELHVDLETQLSEESIVTRPGQDPCP